MAKNSLFNQFIHSEKAGGLVLIGCTLLSLLIANSPAGAGFLHFWHLPARLALGPVDIPFRLEEWINDGLMTIFFLQVGLEMEREIYLGELSSRKKALLPVLAALGGMIVPAAIHFLLNRGTETQTGFGIPMATDIAFSLGVLSLLGKRFPLSLKVFLTALAIIDDLGAVIVIAIFYTERFSLLFLGFSFALITLLTMLNRRRVNSPWIYFPGGILLWYLLYRSGVHPTLSGVILAFLIPFRCVAARRSLSARTEQLLHKPVAFLIVPLFALANTAIRLPAGWTANLFSSNSLGIELGLILGKCAGIAGFCLLAIGSGRAVWPEGMNRRRLIGMGFLGGIGFTMSIFISNLAFPEAPEWIESSKVAVLLASLVSAVLGFVVLKDSGPWRAAGELLPASEKTKD